MRLMWAPSGPSAAGSADSRGAAGANGTDVLAPEVCTRLFWHSRRRESPWWSTTRGTRCRATAAGAVSATTAAPSPRIPCPNPPMASPRRSAAGASPINYHVLAPFACAARSCAFGRRRPGGSPGLVGEPAYPRTTKTTRPARRAVGSVSSAPRAANWSRSTVGRRPQGGRGHPLGARQRRPGARSAGAIGTLEGGAVALWAMAPAHDLGPSAGRLGGQLNKGQAGVEPPLSRQHKGPGAPARRGHPRWG